MLLEEFNLKSGWIDCRYNPVRPFLPIIKMKDVI